MKILKILRKAEFALSFAMLLFLVSCSQYDDMGNSTKSDRSLTSREVNNEDVNALYQLKERSDGNETTGENLNDYLKWAEMNDMTIGYVGFADSKTAVTIMDNNLEQNIAFAKSTGLYSDAEMAVIQSFVAKITDKNGTMLASEALASFKSGISKLDLSPEKVAFYQNMFNTFDLMSKVDATVYNPNVTVSNVSKCWQNVVGLCIAYAGLFTIEVGSMGAATWLAVGGFVYASATFGGGCR